jgi:hypothetical protein
MDRLRDAMRNEIDNRFRSNLTRVRALVAVYQERAGAGSGRSDVQTTDLLRAAVVFLHATMEDALRSVLAWKWPLTDARAQLKDIGVLVGGEPQQKVTLADLIAHRGSSVDDVIRASIGAYLEKSNFNNLGDVKAALVRSGLDVALVAPYERPLAAMMARRHLIVHRVDRHDVQGSGHHAAASLGQSMMWSWIAAVEGLCSAIVAAL